MAAKKKQNTTDTPSTAQTEPDQESQEINLDELTTDQAFGILTNAVRQQALVRIPKAWSVVNSSRLIS